MIYTPQNSQDLVLVDITGNAIRNVFYYDSDTGRTGFYPMTHDGKYIIDGPDLKEYKQVQAWTTLTHAQMIPKSQYKQS